MKLEVILNILHYCIYKADYKLRLLFNKINPFMLIHKLPFQKRRYEKLGIDINKVVNQSFSDKRYGLSVMVAGGMIVGILFLLMMAFVLTVLKLTDIDVRLRITHFLFFGITSSALCYLFVFRDEKYQAYFDDFDRWTKSERKKYAWASLAFVIGVMVLFFWSL